MSCAAYAKRRGVSGMAVSLAIKHGRLKASVVRNEYGQPKISDPDLADREWAANTDWTDAPQYAPKAPAVPAPVVEQVAPPAEEPGSIAGAAERQKHWSAKLAELKYHEAAAELVPASDVAREWTDLLTEVKTKLLGVPSRLRQTAPHLAAPDITQVEELIREALTALSPDVPEVTP